MWTDASKTVNDDVYKKGQLPASSSSEIETVEEENVQTIQRVPSKEILEICKKNLAPSSQIEANPASNSTENPNSTQTIKTITERKKSENEKNKLRKSRSTNDIKSHARSSTYPWSSSNEGKGFFPTLSRQDLKQLHDNFYKEKPKPDDVKKEKSSSYVTNTITHVTKDMDSYFEGSLSLNEALSSIHKAMAEIPWICCIVLENIESQVKSQDFDTSKSSAINLLVKILEGLEGQNIFKEEKTIDIIKRIGFLNEELYTLVQVYLKEVIAKELIQAFLKAGGDKNVLLSHCWFIGTEFFIKMLCQEAEHDPSHAQPLLEAVYDMISQPSFYHIPASSKNDLLRSLKEIPKQPPYKEIRHKLLEATNTNLHNLQIEKSSYDLLLAVYYKEDHGHAFIEAMKAIESGHESRIEHVLDHLALDLKKLEAVFLTSICASEFVSLKKGKPVEEALHINAYIQYTNALTHYAISRILSSAYPHVRVRWYEFFIQLIKKSLKIGNFNAAFTLFTALQNRSISRLKVTYSFMSEKCRNELDKIQEVFSYANNFKNYREYIGNWHLQHGTHAKNTGAIPLFALFLKNFTFIDDGNPTHLPSGQLNEEKISMLADQHAHFQKYQNDCIYSAEKLLDHRYHYNIPNEIHNEIKKIERHSKGFNGALNEMAALSEDLEPRLSPREKIDD